MILSPFASHPPKANYSLAFHRFFLLQDQKRPFVPFTNDALLTTSASLVCLMRGLKLENNERWCSSQHFWLLALGPSELHEPIKIRFEGLYVRRTYSTSLLPRGSDTKTKTQGQSLESL